VVGKIKKDGVRLLGKGALTAKVSFSVAGASKSAVEAVEKAGGSVTLTGPAAAEAAE
jgi:large subunit ribosomal protein L15